MGWRKSGDGTKTWDRRKVEQRSYITKRLHAYRVTEKDQRDLISAQLSYWSINIALCPHEVALVNKPSLERPNQYFFIHALVRGRSMHVLEIVCWKFHFNSWSLLIKWIISNNLFPGKIVTEMIINSIHQHNKHTKHVNKIYCKRSVLRKCLIAKHGLFSVINYLRTSKNKFTNVNHEVEKIM